jgi:ParB family chromosome partitioning protein
VTVRPPRHQQGLGRGLASLIPQRTAPAGSTDIPIARIQVNPYQPRKNIDDDALASLAASIAEHGVIQPIIVSETLDGYQLIAGERRLRAAILVGLDRIPAVIRQAAEQDQLQLALIENLQREELHPLDEAAALARLMESHGYSHEMLADSLGRARSSVSETLAINTLPDWLRAEARERRIARNLLVQLARIDDQSEQRRAWEAVKDGASVRELKERRAANNKRVARSPFEQTMRLGQSFIRQLQEVPREQLAADPARREALVELRDTLNRILSEGG